MDASALHCPNCGASVDQEAHRCQYCQARLATTSCPVCFATIFEDASFCPHCGARRTRAPGANVRAICPACDAALESITVGSTPLLECPRCDGIWLTAEEFDAVCASAEARAAVLDRWTSPPPATTAVPVRYRPCVRCGKMMNRVNFGRVSGTVIDVCRGHGAFLDRGALRAIVTFIQAGGLDRARQREIETLRDEQQRLRELQAKAIRQSDDAPNRVVGLGWSLDGVLSFIDWLKGR